MKRVASALTVAALTFTGGVCLADTGITRMNAFVRQGPSVESPAIGSLQKGVSLSYSAAPVNGNWVKIQYKGKEGYVAKKIIGPGTVAKTAVPPTSALVAAIPTLSPDTVAAVPAATPAVNRTPVFEIVQDVSAEELRLQAENAKQAMRIKELELAVGEITVLKKEIANLKQEVLAKASQIEKYNAMFPYIEIIDAVEDSGKDVLLTGIGKARMIESGKRVIIRLEGEDIAVGDRVMKSVAKERYQTGATDKTRVYYVLNSQSIKSTK